MKCINKQIPYIYIYIYSKVKERYPHRALLKSNEVVGVLKKICRIPKVLIYPILYQMEECSLLKRVNHQKFRVLKSDCEKILKNLRVRCFWE